MNYLDFLPEEILIKIFTHTHYDDEIFGRVAYKTLIRIWSGKASWYDYPCDKSWYNYPTQNIIKEK